jgi:hypothetical protein
MSVANLDTQKENSNVFDTGYPHHSIYFCCNFYKKTDETWDKCPNCGLRPKKWTFDNGRSTGCGCGNNDYDHFSIFAESIMSVYKRTGEIGKYDSDELRKNWNHWCRTGETLFAHAGKRIDGRW